MGKNTNTKKYVKHSRYGSHPIPSEYNLSKHEIENAHWQYTSLKYFQNTVIPADISKQNYAVFPRKVYIDIEEQCEVCKRPFIFFAQEQKYWFEDLGFWIDAHCTRCIECRKKEQEIKAFQITYETLIKKEDRTIEESKKLKNIALELYQIGIIKNKSIVDSISTD